MTMPSIREVIPPNPTNSKSSWIDQVVAYYVTSILFGNDDNVPPVGPKLPEHIIRQYVGLGTRGQDYNAGPLINLVRQWASWVADNWTAAGPALAGMGWSLGAPPAQDLPDIQTQLTIRGQDIDLARSQIEADATKYVADQQLEAARVHAQATMYAADRQKEATIAAADIAAKAQIEAAAIRARADETVARIQQETAIEVARIQTENEWRIFLEAEAGASISSLPRTSGSSTRSLPSTCTGWASSSPAIPSTGSHTSTTSRGWAPPRPTQTSLPSRSSSEASRPWAHQTTDR